MAQGSNDLSTLPLSKFSSLSAPTKIEELTAGSDEKTQRIFVTGIQLESGAREETGRFRDVKRCVATGDRTRVSGISLLRHNR